MTDGPILVTGAAGFIGFHVAQRLLRDGRDVVGLDNMNAYYDPALKEARHAELAKSNRLRFVKLDLADREGVAALVQGVPFSLRGSPRGAGWRPIFADGSICLCGCQSDRLHHDSRRMPPQWLPAFAVRVVFVGLRLQHENAVLRTRQCRPSLESLWRIEKSQRAHVACLCAFVRNSDDRLAIFHRLWPWGRPDMAMWIFARAIIAGEPIKLFNNGNMQRDFTYIDDVGEVGCAAGRSRSRGKSESCRAACAGSRIEQRAVAALQHRQQQAGRVARGRAPA